MELDAQRKYLNLEQLPTEELEKLLVQDFDAMDSEEPNVEFILAITEVINEREKATGHQMDVNAAWKDFQENYRGKASAFARDDQ